MVIYHHGIMPGMDLTLDGLTLHVTDLERSVDFYRRLPGAHPAIHRPPRFACSRSEAPCWACSRGGPPGSM